MRGRAGRKGLDTKGESILMVQNDLKNLDKAMKLITNELQPVKSRAILLDQNGKIKMNENFKRLTLESIANGMLETSEDIKNYLNSTFFAHQTSKELTDAEVSQIIDALNDNREPGSMLINRVEDDQGVVHFLPSNLASAILSSSMSPDEAMKVYAELKKTMFAVALNCDLHLLYHLVPNSNLENKYINWNRFYDILIKITEGGRQTELQRNVVELLEINMKYVIDATAAPPTADTAIKKQHIKFFFALALMEIMNEKPLGEVAAKFGIYRGELQTIQMRSSSYCGMLCIFTKKLGWENLSLLLKNFQDRLCFGVHQNLIELMSISCLNGQMARMLYDAGFVDAREIAYAKVIDIEKVFLNSVPAESSASNRRYWVSNSCKSMNENEISREIIKLARQIIETAAGRQLDWDDDVKNIDILTAQTSQSDSSGYVPDKTRIQVIPVNERLSQVSPLKKPTSPTKYKSSRRYSNQRQYSPKKYDQHASSQNSSSTPFEISYNATSPTRHTSPYETSSPVSSDPSDSATNKRPPTDQKPPAKKRKPDIVNSTSIYPECSTTSDRDVIFSASQQSSIEASLSRQSSFDGKIDSDESQRSLQTNLNSQYLCAQPTVTSQSAIDQTSHNREIVLFESTQESFRFNDPLSAGSKANSTVAKLDKGRSTSERAQDEKCFKIVDSIASELCGLLQEKKYQFEHREISAKKPDKFDSFVYAFQRAEVQLIYFHMEPMEVKEEDFVSGTVKKVQNTKVQPDFIDHIDLMCVMLGTTTIYHLDREMCKRFKQRVQADDFRIEHPTISCISFDAKFTLKMFKCCFGMSDANLAKIMWYDPKVAHWLINPDADEPDSILKIAESYMEIDQPRNFIKQCLDRKELSGALGCTLLLYLVMSQLKRELKEKKLYEAYINVELPILTVFADCELNGFTLDSEYREESTTLWVKLVEDLRKLIYKRSGERDLNVRSPELVKKVLKKLGLYAKLRSEYGLSFASDKMNTGKEILEKMRKIDPLAGKLSGS